MSNLPILPVISGPIAPLHLTVTVAHFAKALADYAKRQGISELPADKWGPRRPYRQYVSRSILQDRIM